MPFRFSKKLIIQSITSKIRFQSTDFYLNSSDRQDKLLIKTPLLLFAHLQIRPTRHSTNTNFYGLSLPVCSHKRNKFLVMREQKVNFKKFRTPAEVVAACNDFW